MKSNLDLKRLIDVIGSLFCLIICAPFFVLIAVAIKLDSPGRIFFVQQRTGKDGVPFDMFKFRSMVSDAEQRINEVKSELEDLDKARNDPRITRVGGILRRLSLDELPQFFNVLKGEMSLVGPRPEVHSVVQAKYKEWHRRTLVVRPGITGPMQVNGRGELDLEDRIPLYLDYIENMSIRSDFEYLLKTIPVVLKGKGAF